jgi:hypothetical protein
MFIPIIYGMKAFRTFGADLRIFYSYLIILMIAWIIATVFAFQGKNNHVILNVVSMIEFGLLLWVVSLWQKNSRIQLAIRITIIAYVIILLSEIIVMQNINDFTTFSGPLEYVMFIVFSALTLYGVNQDTNSILTDQPRFWISSGILLFSSGALVVIIFSRWLLQNNPSLLKNALIIQSVSSSVANILYFVGFRCHYKMQKSGGS